jgi:hypothetical protein
MAPEPQAVLRRRAARGHAPRAHAGARCAVAHRPSSSACRSTGRSSLAARPAPVDQKAATFVGWGERLFATTANGGFNCAGCHGATGGGGNFAPFAVTDVNTGEVTAVNWTRPALNTIFYRFSKDEVRFILVYGRPFSPMSAWGVAWWWPDERPADRNAARVPREHPDRARGLPHRGSVRRLATRTCPRAARCRHHPGEIQGAVEKYMAANGASEGEALFNLDLA